MKKLIALAIAAMFASPALAGYPDKPMDTRFPFQESIRVLALHLYGNRFDSTLGFQQIEYAA